MRMLDTAKLLLAGVVAAATLGIATANAEEVRP